MDLGQRGKRDAARARSRYTWSMLRTTLLAAIAAIVLTSGADAAVPELPTARQVDPAGRLTPLEAYSTGVAISPDGKTVLAVAGARIQGGAAPSAPGPLPSANPGVALMVIDAATGTVRQNLQLPDAFQDVVFTRDGGHAYVAGGSRGGVYALNVDKSGVVSQGTTYVLGGLVSALALSPDERALWVGEPEAGKIRKLDLASGSVTQTVPVPAPNKLALSADGRTLYATNWRGSAIDAIDTSSGALRSLATGLHPTDVAVTPSGEVVVADANDASLATFGRGDDHATYTDLAQLARRSDSPNALAVSRSGRVYVSLGGDDAIAVLEPSSRPGLTSAPPAGVPLPGGRVVTAAGIMPAGPFAPGRPRGRLARACHRRPSHGPRRKRRCHNRRGPHRHHRRHARTRRKGGARHAAGTRHGARHVTGTQGDPRASSGDGRSGSTTRSAQASGDHAPRAATPLGWRVAGLIPTAWYPDALAASPDSRTLYVVSARGLGRSAGATVPYVDPDPVSPLVDSAYATVGTLQSIALPDDQGLTELTRKAQATLREQAPSPGAVATTDNPIFAGPAGPIKHVIYITRENKTYDSVLGDLHPGRPGNALVLFGRDVTPNIHELQTQFAESDNFTYDGFASVVGHMWEDTGMVSDVFERAVGSNTGAHFSHGNDSWHDPTNYPTTGLLTEQAHRAGLSVRTYNEELAQQSGLVPANLQAPASVYPDYNLAVPDNRRETGWEQEFRQFAAHRCTADLASTYGADCSLPAFEYVYLGEDHTTVVDQPGYPTIQAQVADNDLATAKVIEAVSHSQYWSSTLVIVVEDDPQGTGDSSSAYHGFIGIASPYVKRGTISHSHYDLTSVVGAIDRVLGLPPITDFALTNRPLETCSPLPRTSRRSTPIKPGSSVTRSRRCPPPTAGPERIQRMGSIHSPRPTRPTPRSACEPNGRPSRARHRPPEQTQTHVTHCRLGAAPDCGERARPRQQSLPRLAIPQASAQLGTKTLRASRRTSPTRAQKPQSPVLAPASDKKLKAALEPFETLFFNNLTLVLDRYFVHRLAGPNYEGKNGNPLNEAVRGVVRGHRPFRSVACRTPATLPRIHSPS